MIPNNAQAYNTQNDDNIYIGSFISSRILRAILIAILALALLCAIVTFNNNAVQGSDYLSTRIALIAILMAAIAVSILFFLYKLLVALEYYVSIITDIIFAFLILILSIVALIREIQISNAGYANNAGYNPASFGFAAAFGFLAFPFYLILIGLAKKESYRDRPYDLNDASGFGSPFRTFGRTQY